MSSKRLLNRKRRTDKVTFAWDPDDVPKLTRLQDAAAEARKAADKPRAKADERGAAEAAEKAVDDFAASIPTITFHLEACGRKKAESMVLKHPPTGEQQKAHREAQEAAGADRPTPLQYNPDTFPPALVAKCCKRIVLTHQDDDPDDDGPQPDEDGVVTYEREDIDAGLIGELFDDAAWSTLDVGILFMVCDRLNQASTGVNRDLVDRLGNG